MYINFAKINIYFFLYRVYASHYMNFINYLPSDGGKEKEIHNEKYKP